MSEAPEPTRGNGWAFLICVWLAAAVSVGRYVPHLVSLLAVTVDSLSRRRQASTGRA